jgi:hypothetical protein
MRLWLKMLGLAALVMSMGPPRVAQAATVTTSASYPMTYTNWHGVLSIARFDPALGTLTGIRFRLEGSVGGDVRFESMDAKSATVRTILQATVTLSRPDFTPLVITIPVCNNVDNVTAFDGVIDFGGTSGRSYLGLIASNADSILSPPPASDLVTFTGVSPISLPIAALGNSKASGAGNLVTSFRTAVAAKMVVTYIYEPWPQGACCDHATGNCSVTTQALCNSEWLGAGTVCSLVTCPPPVFDGACCAPNGDCRISTQAECPGTWILNGACSPNPCPQPPIGACCDAFGVCTMTTEAACVGSWTVGGTCTPNSCPPIPVREKTWGWIKNNFR